MQRFEAARLGLSHYNTGIACKHGHISSRRVNDRVCMACDRVNKKQYAVDNPEKVVIKKQNEYSRNREKYLATKKDYRQKNKGLINAAVASRKKRIITAIPKWVGIDELWMITEVYSIATLRTKIFGFSWHVDHIVPMQGKLVSGLHTISNLQVIPAIENLKKKNKFEVLNGF